MRDAQRLAQACKQAGVSDGQFYLACVLLACVGIEAALTFVRGQWERGLTFRPYQPALLPEEVADEVLHGAPAGAPCSGAPGLGSSAGAPSEFSD